jgi:hypothetical protein
VDKFFVFSQKISVMKDKPENIGAKKLLKPVLKLIFSKKQLKEW